MARRKQVSPPDEFGNRFVTYTEITPEAVLAQPDLRTTKKSVQTQRIAKNNGGGDFNPDTFNTPPSSTPPSSTVTYGPPPPNMAQMGLVDVAAQDQAETLGNVGKAVTTVATTIGKGAALLNPFTALALGIGYGVQAKAFADKATINNKTLPEQLEDEIKGVVDPIKSLLGGAKQELTIEQQINQEPEKGYRSTGNPRGSRSGVSDISESVNAGEGNRGGLEGLTTRGPSPITKTNYDSFDSSLSSFGIGGDPSDAPGSGEDSEGIP